MILNEVNSIEQYWRIVEQYRKKGVASNDYLQREVEDLIDNGNLFESSNKCNAYFFVKKTVGVRMYYYINDFNVKPDFDGLKDIVVEILYRGENFYPYREVEFFEKIGFKTNLIRDQYLGIYKDLAKPKFIEKIQVRNSISLQEVEDACMLFNASFDPLSGDYLPIDLYEKLLISKAILIAHSIDGQFLGALHMSLVGKVASISHIAVLPEARGRYVGQALLDVFVENNVETEKSRYILWVQQQNQAAVSMYQKKGFKYVSKSTISLIK